MDGRTKEKRERKKKRKGVVMEGDCTDCERRKESREKKRIGRMNKR